MRIVKPEKVWPFDFEMTLLFLINKRGEILLGKKMDKIGQDLWNGSGGKMELVDASIEERAVKEVKQEWGLIVPVDSLQKVAECYSRNIREDGSKFTCKVHVFRSRTYFGIPRSSPEMSAPRPFKINEFPLNDMIAADRFWVQDACNGRKVVVMATMKDNQRTLVGLVNVIPVDYFA